MRRIISHLANDWYKYLLELIVITAGVVGAFSLNNWKEQKKIENQKRIVYGFIKEDLQADITEIDSALVRFEKSIEAMNKIVYGKVKKEEYSLDPSYINSFFGYEDLIVDQRGLDLLNNSLDVSDNRSTILANKIAQFYSDHRTEIDGASKELSSVFSRVYNEFSREDWFFEFAFNEELMPFAEYAADNHDFKKRIGAYLIIYKIYVDELIRFREGGKLLIKEIDDHLNQ